MIYLSCCLGVCDIFRFSLNQILDGGPFCPCGVVTVIMSVKKEILIKDIIFKFNQIINEFQVGIYN